MNTTNRLIRTLVAILMLAAVPSSWGAEIDRSPIIKSAALISSVPLYGVSMDMTPRAAFEHLMTNGFRAGNLEKFEDWDSDGIEFVRGVYGSPEGYTSLTLSRRGERLIGMSETFNAPGSPIDANTAITDLKRHFGIQGDKQKCSTPRPHAAMCQVRDAEENAAARYLFNFQIMSTMRIVTISHRVNLDEG